MADPFTPKFVDLVRNYTTSTGTGSFTLSTAVNGFTGIASALAVGDQFYYSCIGVDKPAEREVGRGTLLANSKVSRAPINGTLTNFSTGTKAIALIAAAEWFEGVAASQAAPSTGGAPVAADLAALAALDGSKVGTVFVQQEGRAGNFVWDASNLSAEVAADPAQGIYVAPSADATGSSGAWKRAYDGTLRPEWFGAKGDGVTIDDGPLAKLSACINAAGGGSIELTPGAVYLIGGQTLSPGHQSSGYAFPPDVPYPLQFSGCARPVEVRMNGATIKCRDGAKYGRFNDDGTPIDAVFGTLGGGVASPYFAMIRALDCTGGILISNGELDGNKANVDLGGYYDAGGWQIGCVGVSAEGTTSRVNIANVNSHHHMQDGLTINTAITADEDPANLSYVLCSRFDHNGRQGCSIVGGKGWRFVSTSLSWTGKDVAGDDTLSTLHSGPGSGVDFEAEAGRIVRDIGFTDCEIVGNWGAGIQAVGDVEGVTFNGGVLIGTTNWAAVPTADYFRFHGTTFVGAIANAMPSADADKATQFHGVRHYMGAARSPTGAVYRQAANPNMADMGGLGSQNILFSDYVADTEGDATALLPATLDGLAIYRNTAMRQDSTTTSYPRGQYYGRNTLTSGGPIDNYGGQDFGEVTRNGVSAPHYSFVDNYIMGSVTIGNDAHGGNVDGKALILTNTSGYGLHAVMNANTSQLYLDCRTDGFAFGELHLRGSAVFLNDSATDRLQVVNGAGVAVTGTLSATGKLGYAAGAGGTAVQPTSKSTAVTLDKLCGAITMNGAALAANTAVSFTLTDSAIGTDDDVRVWVKSGNATAATYRAWSEGNAAGSRKVVLQNISAGSLSEAVVVGFLVIKGTIA